MRVAEAVRGVRDTSGTAHQSWAAAAGACAAAGSAPVGGGGAAASSRAAATEAHACSGRLPPEV